MKRLARWILREEIAKAQMESIILLTKAYYRGVRNGYGLGEIAGRTDAHNKGYILGKSLLERQVEEIVGND